MNYLAHAYLSGDDPEVLIGNLIADVVRGRKTQNLCHGIQIGLRLHREIDAFTDRHPVFRHSVSLLRPKHRHYSTALVDVFYDHFLAQHFQALTGQALTEFAENVNRAIHSSKANLPLIFHENARNLNWLTSYATREGISESLRRMSKRSRFGLDFTPAIAELTRYKKELEADFLRFFPEVCRFAETQLLDPNLISSARNGFEPERR